MTCQSANCQQPGENIKTNKINPKSIFLLTSCNVIHVKYLNNINSSIITDITLTCPLSHLLPGPCWILLSWLSNNGRATWLLSTGNEWISHGVKSSSRPPNLENKSGNILHVLVNRMADWQSCLLVIRVWQCALW